MEAWKRHVRVIVGLVGCIVALVLVAAWLALRPPPQAELEGGPLLPDAEMVDGPAVDSLARRQLADLEALVLRLEDQVAALTQEVAALREAARTRPDPARPDPGTLGPSHRDPLGPGIGDYAKLVVIPERRSLNEGLTVASPRFLEDLLGRPRESLSENCEPMENPRLRDMLRLEEVGPIRVRMLEPAVEDLHRIFARVEAIDPDLHDRIRSSGSLCVRQIRNAPGRVSSHAYGLALDINIDGSLDGLADGMTQLGLLLMSDIFREEGWVWGAGFGREDSMHFEVGREKLETWRSEGRI